MTKKQKLEAAKQEAVLVAARAAVVDEAGTLEAELAPFRLKLRRLDELRRAIRGWYLDADPARFFSISGEDFTATVGACGNETVIHDMASIFEAAGKDKFLAACKLTLAKLGDLVDPALARAVTGTAQTGSRDLVIMPIQKPARSR